MYKIRRDFPINIALSIILKSFALVCTIFDAIRLVFFTATYRIQSLTFALLYRLSCQYFISRESVLFSVSHPQQSDFAKE